MNEPHYYYITDEEYIIAATNGINKSTLDQRVRVGMWKRKRALETPPRKKINWGKWRNVAEQNGISYNTLLTRFKLQNWSMEMAATTPVIPHKEIWGFNQKLKNKEQFK